MQTYTNSSLGELPTIKINNSSCSAEISLYGAHVLSYNNGNDKLWLSEKAALDGNKAIRGGIPLCWPWFGDKEGTNAHGFARITKWDVLAIEETPETTVVKLHLPINTHSEFPFQFELNAEFIFGTELTIKLMTQNSGDSCFDITAALHSYIAVSEINDTQLQGLADSVYLDKLDNNQPKPTPSPYTIHGALDRIHKTQQAIVQIHCGQEMTTTKNQGHDSIVVWNPWREGARSMKDMANAGYTTMICTEAAITEPLTLAPGEAHTLSQVIC